MLGCGVAGVACRRRAAWATAAGWSIHCCSVLLARSVTSPLTTRVPSGATPWPTSSVEYEPGATEIGPETAPGLVIISDAPFARATPWVLISGGGETGMPSAGAVVWLASETSPAPLIVSRPVSSSDTCSATPPARSIVNG